MRRLCEVERRLGVCVLQVSDGGMADLEGVARKSAGREVVTGRYVVVLMVLMMLVVVM